MHLPSRLGSSVAVYYSMSSDKFDVIFLRSAHKKVFYIKHLIYVFIIFIEQRDYSFWKKTIVQYICKFDATAQKMRFFIKDFYSKCDQIHRKLRIWSHLLENYLMENFILCALGGIFKPIKLLAAQSTAYTLRNRQVKQPFVKENEKKNICIKEIYICKILEIYR